MHGAAWDQAGEGRKPQGHTARYGLSWGLVLPLGGLGTKKEAGGRETSRPKVRAPCPSPGCGRRSSGGDATGKPPMTYTAYTITSRREVSFREDLSIIGAGGATMKRFDAADPADAFPLFPLAKGA